MAAKRKIKRGTGAPSKLYFNSGTQDAIVAYQRAETKKEKDQLYVEQIMPAFEKLAENLINIYKFTALYDSFDDLKNDCVNFLFETIRKFDHTRGTNAFSYFNVVAKNWLIIRTKQKNSRLRRNVSLDDFDQLSNSDVRMIEEHNVVPSQEDEIENLASIENILYTLHDMRNKMRTENELLCINSIITIFENINDLDLLNKGAVLLYMRELSGLTPKQLTTTMQAIKKMYRKNALDQTAFITKFGVFGEDDE